MRILHAPKKFQALLLIIEMPEIFGGMLNKHFGCYVGKRPNFLCKLGEQEYEFYSFYLLLLIYQSNLPSTIQKIIFAGLIVLPTAIINGTPLECQLCTEDLCRSLLMLVAFFIILSNISNVFCF